MVMSTILSGWAMSSLLSTPSIGMENKRVELLMMIFSIAGAD